MQPVFFELMRVTFAAQVSEVGSGQLAQMSAKECHFVSDEKQFDKAALPQWHESPTGFNNKRHLCSAFLYLNASDRNRIHCGNWSGAKRPLPSALLHWSPLWSWHGLAWPGSHGPCFVSLPRVSKLSPNQTRLLSAARLACLSKAFRQG